MRVSSYCDGNINYSENNDAFGEPVNQVVYSPVPAPVMNFESEDPCSDNPVQHGVEHPLGVQGDDAKASHDQLVAACNIPVEP